MRLAALGIALITTFSATGALAEPRPAPAGPPPGEPPEAYVHLYRARGTAAQWVRAVVTLDDGLAMRIGANDCTVMRVPVGDRKLLLGWGKPGQLTSSVYDYFAAEPGQSYYYRYTVDLGPCASNCMRFDYFLEPVTPETYAREAARCKFRLAEPSADAFLPMGGYARRK